MQVLLSSIYLMFLCPGLWRPRRGLQPVCLAPRGALVWPGCVSAVALTLRSPASCRSARVSGGWAGASVSPRALWVTDTAAARWGPRDHGTTGRWWAHVTSGHRAVPRHQHNTGLEVESIQPSAYMSPYLFLVSSSIIKSCGQSF